MACEERREEEEEEEEEEKEEEEEEAEAEEEKMMMMKKPNIFPAQLASTTSVSVPNLQSFALDVSQLLPVQLWF